MSEPPARRRARTTNHRAADLFALYADTIEFLGRSAWPIVDLVIRLWMAKQAILPGLLLANDWYTALLLAANEYPVPWLSPGIEAFLGITLQLAGGGSLLLGLGTRLGALAIVLLNVATQVYYTAVDLDLFRVALAAGYVRGPGSLSLDHLLIQGLARSPVPFTAAIVGFLNETRAPLAAIYRLALRVWLSLALFLGTSAALSTLGALEASLTHWMPWRSAMALFAGAAPFLALPLGLGLATRLTAALALCASGYSEMMATDDFSVFWTLGMALLLVSGPGALSLDGAILD